MTRFSTAFPFALCSFFSLALLQSCEIAGDITLEVEDFTTQFEENQELGTNIGQIKATADGATLQFEVISSIPADAFAIDGKSGVLSIADPQLFDFEQRNSLSAVVEVRADDQSEQIDILVELEDALAPIEDWNRFTKSWETEAFLVNMVATSCRMDDQLSISGTGNYSYDSGMEFCEEAEMLWLESGSWDLDENLQYVIFDKGTASEFRADIENFENGNLSLNTVWNNDNVQVSFKID